jgi:glycogen synthase
MAGLLYASFTQILNPTSMSEITKEHFDQALKGLATKKDLDVILTGIANLATQESLNQVSDRLTTIEGILNQHTTTLDAIVKDTSNWNTEMIVMRERMKRYEDALKLVGQKLNLDLQTLLH